MNKIFNFLLIFPFLILQAQTNTEVYLFDLKMVNDSVILSSGINISNNPGYDNQPSFFNDTTILFSSTRANQTDIAQYDIQKGTVNWITNTLGGSEYSPLKIPNKEEVSAIRLDTNGLQRLYTYDILTGKDMELLKDLKVGYHLWYNDHIIVSSVLVDNRMDLVVSDLKKGTHNAVEKNVGRSLHKIPNSNLVSYISKEREEWSIKSLNPITGGTENVVSLLPNVEDICWLNSGEILLSKENRMYKFRPKTTSNWVLVKSFEEENLQKVTRLASNKTNDKLAIVSEE